MVRITVEREIRGGYTYCEMAGLHEDNKPTGAPLSTGCLFLEVDTGDVYAYDEANEEWNKVAELGGDS